MSDTLTATGDRLVVVDARRLDDLLEVARLLAERSDPADPLTHAARGAIAAVRTEAVVDPLA